MEAEEVYRCCKCGICLQWCPVYRLTLDESASPRGKVQLIRHYAERGLPSSGHLNEIVSRCLMCGSCEANCPSRVEHEPLFVRMRECMRGDYGLDWKKRVLFHFLGHQQRLDAVAKLGALGRNHVLDWLWKEWELGHVRVTNLPKFNKKPFRQQVQATTEPSVEVRGTVVYFVGCGTNYVYGAVGRATVKVLRAMGYRVEILPEQVCCGLPMFFKGAMETARPNILCNLSLLDRSDVEAIVTDCATCGAALRKGYPMVVQEAGADPSVAERVAQSTRDISEFVLSQFDSIEGRMRKGGPPKPVTYHSPCHLRNSQGVESAVEELLRRIPGVEYRRSVDYNSCCGGGGTFFYDYADLSKQIVDEKIRNAKETGAEVIATGCPGCSVNLAGNLAPEDGLTVTHPIELVAEALED